ncbi:MAG: chromosomal replication initiator protein DnaA [Lachnospiraceae bacterium]|nr:chromosomal replication initiator protein DnaA [Lachnospiraceae bacterium]
MSNIVIEKWDEILETMKNEYDISDVSFNTWLKPLKVHNITDNTLTILAADEIHANYIEKKYSKQFIVTIGEITGISYQLHFIKPDDILREEQNALEGKNGLASSKLDNLSDNNATANLNPRYTFDTFVVGTNNSFAHAASLAVAESPGEIYNPLFIYGGVGLGKTHLMHSIAHFILERNPRTRVLYVTSEKFTNEIIDAIRKKDDISTIQFREKYRNVDVLLIDDIQFIIGKEATQEEFFHTFNALHESKKQIIISSDKPPKDIETLEERLRSRFEWGLTVDIQSPNYETRMAILHKKAELENYRIDNEIIEYIANNIKSNIRELEGALTKIHAYSSLSSQKLTVELAEEVLKDSISLNEAQEVTPDLVLKVVAEHFGITPADIISQKRIKELVYPRQIVMYLCRSFIDMPLKQIGLLLGRRNHSTIINGCKKIDKDLKTNESTRNTIDVLKKKISTGG